MNFLEKSKLNTRQLNTKGGKSAGQLDATRYKLT